MPIHLCILDSWSLGHSWWVYVLSTRSLDLTVELYREQSQQSRCSLWAGCNTSSENCREHLSYQYKCNWDIRMITGLELNCQCEHKPSGWDLWLAPSQIHQHLWRWPVVIWWQSGYCDHVLKDRCQAWLILQFPFAYRHLLTSRDSNMLIYFKGLFMYDYFLLHSQCIFIRQAQQIGLMPVLCVSIDTLLLQMYTHHISIYAKPLTA